MSRFLHRTYKPDILKKIEKPSEPFKDYGNNVYAFCIPKPDNRKDYTNISIEFYYKDSDLKKEKDGKSLYFDNEVEFKQSASNNKDRSLIKLNISKTTEENTKKICDDNIGKLDWIHSKSRFAELVESNEDFITDFDFNNFHLIFDKIKTIISQN